MRRLFVWLRSLPAAVRALPRTIAVAGGVVVAAVLVAATVSASRGYNYVMNNPTFCRSCHTMEEAWTRWQTSEHRTVSCHSCHEASIIESTRQVITFVIRQPQRVGKHAVVPKAVCAECHESGDPKWRQVAETAGHKVHERDRKIECVVCHTPGIHRFTPPATVCGTCHVAQTRGERMIKIQAMADQHCIDCHGFLRVNSPLRPTRQTCLSCHRLIPSQANLWPPDAPMQFPCGQCHKPHEQAKPVVVCTSCHEKPRPDMHPAAMLQTTKCTACHMPHRWRIGR